MGPPDDGEELAQSSMLRARARFAADDAIAAMPEPPIESTMMMR